MKNCFVVMMIIFCIAILVLILYCRSLEERVAHLESRYDSVLIEMKENQDELENCTEHYYDRVESDCEKLESEIDVKLNDIEQRCERLNTKLREEILTLIQKGE